MATHAFLKFGLAIALCALGCGNKDDQGSTDAGMSSDSTSGVICAKETRQDTFALGITKVGPAGYSVELVSAVPSPPARFSNAWKLRVRDPQGTPRSPTLQVTPWMPDHNHGAPTKPIITASATVGEYQIDEISLWMPGLWYVKFRIEEAAGTDDLAFAFCVEE